MDSEPSGSGALQERMFFLSLVVGFHGAVPFCQSLGRVFGSFFAWTAEKKGREGNPHGLFGRKKAVGTFPVCPRLFFSIFCA